MIKYCIAVLGLCLLVNQADAQKAKKPVGQPLPAGRTVAATEKPVVAKAVDSVKLKAAFKDLYQTLGIQQTIQERADKQLKSISRMFKGRGVDSAAAYEKVMKEIDPRMDQELVFRAYSKDFTADEMKTLATFFKSATGKKYLENESALIQARTTQIDNYVQRTISSIVTPMMKPIERPAKPNRNGLPQVPGSPTHGGGERPVPAPVPVPVPAPAAPDSTHGATR